MSEERPPPEENCLIEQPAQDKHNDMTVIAEREKEA